MSQNIDDNIDDDKQHLALKTCTEKGSGLCRLSALSLSNQRVTSQDTDKPNIFSSNLLAEIREQEVLARFVRTQADIEYFSRKFIDSYPMERYLRTEERPVGGQLC